VRGVYKGTTYPYIDCNFGRKNFPEREFPSQWGGAKVNINVTNKVEMSEALNTVAGELLDQIAKE